MAKGIIYCMTTVVPGLVKIGKTRCDNFEQRMYSLEKNGYLNVTGLKRKFAIEVEDYDEKEILIHEIFSKSNIPNSELFAIDVELVIQLFASLEGTQIYPESISKEEIFDIVTDEVQKNSDSVNRMKIPNGVYHIADKNLNATMRVESGKFIVTKGSECIPCDKEWMPEVVRTAVIENNVLMEDVVCNSPSTAGWVVLGNNNNGWRTWKTEDGEYIDIFRK